MYHKNKIPTVTIKLSIVRIFSFRAEINLIRVNHLLMWIILIIYSSRCTLGFQSFSWSSWRSWSCSRSSTARSSALWVSSWSPRVYLSTVSVSYGNPSLSLFSSSSVSTHAIWIIFQKMSKWVVFQKVWCYVQNVTTGVHCSVPITVHK